MSFQYHIRTPYQWGLRRYQTEDGDPSNLPTWLAAKFYSISFQLFITLCPGGDSVRILQLKNIVKRFVETTEKHYRAPLGYTVGYESTPSVNCHLCIACSAQLNLHWIEDCLKAILGPYLYTDKAVKVQRFDFQKDGVVYALKCASRENLNRDVEDYDFNNLDLFLPAAEAGLPIFHKRRARAHVRQRERLSRQEQKQIDALLGTKPPVRAPRQLTFKKDFQQAVKEEGLRMNSNQSANESVIPEQSQQRRQLSPKAQAFVEAMLKRQQEVQQPAIRPIYSRKRFERTDRG